MKRDDAEHPVPASLRPAFCQIAGAFAVGDIELRDHVIAGVSPVDAATAERIAYNISAYGDRLTDLSNETWRHSVYRWMDGYWLMLVDLSTQSEPVSDLTLHARVREDNGALLVEIDNVFVP